MKIFDFNIHLPKESIANDINLTILDEQNISFDELESSYKKSVLPKAKLLNGLNIMLFNENLFKAKEKINFFDFVKKSITNCLFTTLLDFRDKDCIKQLEIAYALGVKGLKFHPYVQNISDDEIDKILQLCQKAQQLNMFIAIDTSYGTLNLYKHDNLKLATLIASKIKISPIILLHSGGTRILEAMLIAESQKNIYLETSFSILYYLNSSIERDFAFVYKKIGTNRVLYGSDAPYIDLEDSISFTLNYLEKYNFSDSEIENIFFNTSIEIGCFNE